MKKQLFAGILSLAAACSPLKADTFVNNFVLVAPPADVPQVDAAGFVNNGVFAVDLWSLGFLYNVPYTTANTLGFTNYGILGSTTGLRLDYYNRSTATHNRANGFLNEVGAVVNCGGTNLTALLQTNLLTSQVTFSAWASDIINRGTVEMGPECFVQLKGRNVNLSGGLLNMEGFESGLGLSYQTGLRSGFFDSYWTSGDNNNLVPSSQFGSSFAYTPNYWVTNRDYVSGQTSLFLGFAPAYQNSLFLDASNILRQVVYVQNLDPTISNNVYFVGTVPVVEWVWTNTNIVTGVNSQESLILVDRMFSVTNLMMVTNGIGPARTSFRATYIPTNFFGFGSRQFISGFQPAAPGLTPGFFPAGRATNEFSAYRAIFEPTSVLVPEVANQTYSNVPGRIEITADQKLDLSASRIASENFLSLTATNDFVMDGWTRLLTYAADFNLTKADGQLTVSNLMAPTCPRLKGVVDLYSVRWTNVSVVPNVTTLTNIYNVLLVGSQLSSISPTILQNLTLHSTNSVYISDVLNVVSNLTIDAANVTITTNGPGAQIPTGQLNIMSGNILWTNAFPRLQNLTNWGALSVSNTAFFGGVRYPPFYPTSTVEPYFNFVNHGIVDTLGMFIWATNIESYGLLDSGPLSIALQAGSATLRDGMLNAPAATGDISVQARDLVISNQVLNAGRRLTLLATNYLSDEGPTSSNRWTTGAGGFNLPIRPALANLLGTTIADTAPAQSQVACQWAGTDRGAIASAFTNNAAVGRLFLNAGPNGRFKLTGVGTNSALYVDYLELQNSMTNLDDGRNLSGLLIDSAQPVKIYYAQAVMNGVSVAEKLDHKNNGALNWVPSYAGFFSSTNMLYPDGTTNRLNAALVTSCNIDSDGDGIVNCADPTPVFISSLVSLQVSVTTQPVPATRLSWFSLANANNTVYYKPSLASTNWIPLTNFVSGSRSGTVSILDPLTQTSRYYRVRMDGVLP